MLNFESFDQYLIRLQGLPGGGYYIVLSSPEEDPLNESFLAELEGFLDWTGPLHLDVPGDGVVCRFFEAIAIRRRNEKRNTRLSIHDTFGYVMSTEDAFALSLDKMLETGSNLVLKQLSTEDEISVVRTNWSWGVSALTPGIVDELVHSLPCVGVFVEGKLASWGLTSFYGSISGLGTLEGYRKRGLAKLAIAAVCKAHAEFGMIPCGRTHRSNIPAFRSFESVGYSRTHETNWIDYSEF